MELNSVYTIQVNKYKDNIQGILLKEGNEWLLFKEILPNYMLDGFLIIRKKWIQSIYRDEDEILNEKILKASGKWDLSNPYDEFPLSDTDDLFSYIYLTLPIVQIYVQDDSVTYIGKLSKPLAKSFYLLSLKPNGLWNDKTYLFRKTSVRMISWDSDYVNSLFVYNQSIDKGDDILIYMNR